MDEENLTQPEDEEVVDEEPDDEDIKEMEGLDL